MKKYILGCCFLLMLTTVSPISAREPAKSAELPPSVVDISKENTYPNPSNDASQLVPGDETEALLKTAQVPIENPVLIKMLNESTLRPSKWSVGNYARIYLGNWPLAYISKESSVNWEYREVNDNAVDTRGNENGTKISYAQKSHAKVTGGLTARVPKQREVTQMIMAEAMKKTHLPIAFSTIVGGGTKVDRIYQVEPKKVAHLYGYVPAVNEKGKVVYGEVYLVMRGGQCTLDVKNRVERGIGAWLPVQDHLSLRYVAR